MKERYIGGVTSDGVKDNSLVRVVVRGRRALLIVAYGPMEAEEVLVPLDFSKVPKLDSEGEVELLVVELVPEVVDCPQVLEQKTWHGTHVRPPFGHPQRRSS